MMVSVTPHLNTGRVVLRPFTAGDVIGRQRLGRDPEIIRMFGGTPEFSEPVAMTLGEATAWYEHVRADPNAFHWAVEYAGRFVGTARLHALDEANRKARYAIGLLDRDVLGIGLGTEITGAVLRFGFQTLRLHRIELRVLAYNTRAIRCYRRCGFVEEGRERETAFVDGTWHDDVVMAVLAHEFAG